LLLRRDDDDPIGVADRIAERKHIIGNTNAEVIAGVVVRKAGVGWRRRQGHAAWREAHGSARCSAELYPWRRLPLIVSTLRDMASIFAAVRKLEVGLTRNLVRHSDDIKIEQQVNEASHERRLLLLQELKRTAISVQSPGVAIPQAGRAYREPELGEASGQGSTMTGAFVPLHLSISGEAGC
jgi:hypothetical protein